jgi:hypothetical protein
MRVQIGRLSDATIALSNLVNGRDIVRRKTAALEESQRTVAAPRDSYRASDTAASPGSAEIGNFPGSSKIAYTQQVKVANESMPVAVERAYEGNLGISGSPLVIGELLDQQV